MTQFCWFDLFLQSWAEILKKLLLVDLKTPKCPSEINWPLHINGNHNAPSEFLSTQCDITREFLRDAIVLSSSGEFYYCTLQKLSTYPRRCGVCCCGRRCRRVQGLQIYKKITSDNWQTCKLASPFDIYTFFFLFGPYLQVFYLRHFWLFDGAN